SSTWISASPPGSVSVVSRGSPRRIEKYWLRPASASAYASVSRWRSSTTACSDSTRANAPTTPAVMIPISRIAIGIANPSRFASKRIIGQLLVRPITEEDSGPHRRRTAHLAVLRPQAESVQHDLDAADATEVGRRCIRGRRRVHLEEAEACTPRERAGYHLAAVRRARDFPVQRARVRYVRIVIKTVDHPLEEQDGCTRRRCRPGRGPADGHGLSTRRDPGGRARRRRPGNGIEGNAGAFDRGVP